MRTGPLGIDARTATSYTEACAAPRHRIQSADSRKRTDPTRPGGWQRGYRPEQTECGLGALAGVDDQLQPAHRRLARLRPTLVHHRVLRRYERRPVGLAPGRSRLAVNGGGRGRGRTHQAGRREPCHLQRVLAQITGPPQLPRGAGALRVRAARHRGLWAVGLVALLGGRFSGFIGSHGD